MTLHSGIHLNVPPATYFDDPAPEPSLTQSIAKILIERSPLHAWHNHSRLNPDFQPDDSTKYDIGNIAHSMLIGRGKSLEVLDFDDWRTKAAREAREAAAVQGKLAVLGKHVAKASKMVEAAREQLALRGLGRFFRDGNGEVVLVWQDGDAVDDTGDYIASPIWMRQMVDWLSPDLCEFIDYKTSDLSVAPHGIDRMMCNAGWPIQASMAERGLDVLDPQNAGRRRFYFVAQEAEVPYALTVVELTRGPMTLGHKLLQRAVDIWRHAVSTNRWEGYPLDIVQPHFPEWAESQILAREIEHEERQRATIVPSDIIMAG